MTAEQDLIGIRTKLKRMENTLKRMESKFRHLSWTCTVTFFMVALIPLMIQILT